MKKITFMLFALVAFCWQSNGQIQIGSGTSTTTNVPITSCYGYTYSQQLFLASEINASGSITELSFYLDAATSTTDFSDSVDWVVYLGHSTKTEFTSTTDWEDVTNLTSAYSGTVSFPAEDNWFTITLDTPFVYNGTDNLVLAIDENTSSYNCSMYWQKTDTANDMSIYYRSDSTNPDPTAPPTATGVLSFRANTIFGGITQACPSPSDLTASNIMTTSADLGWTENGTASSYNVEVVASGDTPTGAATDTGVANGFTKSGLLSGTSYDYYVQADCTGGELSAWVGPFTFTTECVAYTVPYSEDFDSTAAGTSTNPTIPNCWSFIDEGVGYGYVSSVGANSFYIYNNYDSSGNYILVSPETTDLSSGNNRVTFDIDGSASQDFIVGTMTDPSDATTFTAIQTITLATSDYESYIVDIPAGTDLYLGFKHGQTGTYDSYYLDNIVVEPIPDCLAPSDLAVSNIMTTSADLSWTENGTAMLWDIEIVDVTAMGTATGMPTATGVTNPYSAMGLSENNTYEYYVRADCAGDGTSTWAGPFAFSTACNAFAIPFTETFDSTSTSESCWRVLNENGDTDAWDTNYTSDVITGDENAALYTDYNSGNNDDWLISPAITLTGNERLKFKYSLQSTGEPNDFEVLLSTSGTDIASFTNTILPLASYNDVDIDNGESTEITIDLSAYTGDVNIAWRVPPGGLDGWRLYIDDVVVDTLPTCPDVASPMMDALTDVSADFSWSVGGTETTWEYANLPSPSTEPASGTSTMATNVELTGLTPETEYDFYVRVDCGGDFGTWTVINYTTPATPPVNDLCSGSVSLPIDGTVVNGTTVGASGAGGATSCNGSIGNDVWYVLTGDGGDITVEVIAANEGAQIGIYESTDGTCAGFTEGSCFASVDDFGALTTDITFASVDGTTYYVNLGAWVSSGNDFPFTITATSSTLSTPSFENNSSFSYFPNPVKNTLTLNAQNTIENVTMYNMLGQEVLRATPNAVNSELNMSNLQDGAYFVKVTIANVTKTIKVIKQ